MIGSIVIGVGLFVLAAVAMYFVGKFLPSIVMKVLDLLLMIWLLSILFTATSGIDTAQALLEKIPYVEYLVTFSAGSKLGQIVTDLF